MTNKFISQVEAGWSGVLFFLVCRLTVMLISDFGNLEINIFH